MRDRDRAESGVRRTAVVVLTVLVVAGVLVCATTTGVARVDGGPGGGAPTAPYRVGSTGVVGETLNATATPATIAAGVGDAIEIEGETTGNESAVRLYLVGPRGAFLDATGDDRSMETVGVDAGFFAATYRAFDRRGAYRLLVIAPRADGRFGTTETLGREALPAGLTQRQAVETVRAAHDGDEVVDLTLRGSTPSLTLNPLDDATVARGSDVTVAGASNRGDGTSVAVELLDGEGRAVVETNTTVDASTGAWSTSVGTTDLLPGTYTLFVDDTVSTASTPVVIDRDGGEGRDGDDDEPTPAETPLPADGTDGTDGAALTPDTGEGIDDVTGAALDNATEGLDGATDVLGDPTRDRSENGTDAAGDETDDTTATSTTATSTTATSANGTTPTNGTVTGTAESTSEGVPGFGVGAAVVAVAVVALVVRRRVS